MMTTTPRVDPAIRRILFALDAVDADPAATAAVIGLAERLGAELVGLVVEDTSLERLARLPFASEIVHSSATVRRIDPPGMQRALRIRAEALRHKFEASAARAPIRYSFRVAGGDLLSEARALSPDADLLVLRSLDRVFDACGTVTLSRRLLRQARCTVLLHHPGADLERPVVALFDDTPAGRRVLTIAAQLARRDGMNLVVLLPPADEDRTERLRREAREQLAHHGIEASYRRLEQRDSAAALARAVAAAEGHTLVISGDDPLAAQERYRQWAPALRCAVVLAR